MGWDPNTIPDRVKELMVDRPKGKVWQTSAEAIQKKADQLEFELHDQFWSFLRRNNFEDVEYSGMHQSTRRRKGVPDFLVCRDSRRLGIEFKVPPNKLSEDQVKFFEMAERQNNRCIVCYDYQSAVHAMKEFFDE
jgi:VRR-NUC domain-containing protein